MTGPLISCSTSLANEKAVSFEKLRPFVLFALRSLAPRQGAKTNFRAGRQLDVSESFGGDENELDTSPKIDFSMISFISGADQ